MQKNKTKQNLSVVNSVSVDGPALIRATFAGTLMTCRHPVYVYIYIYIYIYEYTYMYLGHT